MRRIPVLSILFTFALTVGAGCGPSVSPGFLVLVDAANAEMDFGHEFIGASTTRQVWLRNDGGQPVTLAAAVVEEGESTLWSVALPAARIVEPGQRAAVEVTFAPSLDPDGSPYAEATIRIEAIHTRDEAKTPPVSLRVRGISVGGTCSGPPSALQFGNVGVGDTYRRRMEFRNPSERPIKLSVGTITSRGSDHLAFSFGPDSDTGEVEIGPGETGVVEVTFAPEAEKAHLAFVKVGYPAGICEQAVALSGVGVSNLVSWSPREVDCGYVTPGTSARRTLTFTNLGLSELTLRDLRLSNVTEFAVDLRGGPGSVLNVPGEGGTATVDVLCRPNVYGPRGTSLTFSTDLVSQPAGQVNVRVIGGGPVIEVKPSPTLDFGRVAYFPGATPPNKARRTLTISNVGRAPAVPDVRANLRLGQPDENGEPMLPYWRLEPLNDETSADEFAIVLNGAYSHDQGLSARVGPNSLELSVNLTPRSVGQKRARLTIFSNDASSPETVIELRATALELPSCNYSVSAPSLSFGRIGPGQRRELGFTIRNNGTSPNELCLLSGLQILHVDAHPFFSLVDGPVAQYELPAGAELMVRVRLHALAANFPLHHTISSAVSFFVNALRKPEATVPLDADLGRSCLSFSSQPLDLGTVKLGCSSETRTIEVTHSCEAPVMIRSVGIRAAAGQPAGAPSCPGTQPCPEYTLVDPPEVPTGGFVLSPGDPPLSLQVRYRPLDEGVDSGSAILTVDQAGGNVTYVLPLWGRGDLLGVHEDRFAAHGQKVDMVLAIDSSPGMAPFQTVLEQSIGAFAKAISLSSADLQLAVIDANADGGQQGRFLEGPTHPDVILSPFVADLADQLQEKARVGTASTSPPRCLEALQRALSPPLLYGVNAGFLRPDATLALVCLIASPDSSGQTPTSHLDRLWNIKGHDEKSRLSLSAVAPFSQSPHPSCVPPNGPDLVLSSVVAQTAGFSLDVCAPSWETLLSDAASLMTPRSHYFLGAVPDPSPGSIEVAVNGTPLGPQLWGHDPSRNLIAFAPQALPKQGDAIRVRYPIACHP